MMDLLEKTQKTINKILWFIVILSIFIYSGWEYMIDNYDIHIFHFGNSLLFFLLSIVVYIQNKRLFISFYLLCITAANFSDHVFFNPVVVNLSEYIFALILPIFWLIKKYRLCLINWFNKNFRNSL